MQSHLCAMSLVALCTADYWNAAGTLAFQNVSSLCAQAPYRPHLPEEEGGEPHASYAYAAATAAAKQRSLEHSAEVSHPVVSWLMPPTHSSWIQLAFSSEHCGTILTCISAICLTETSPS